jgi:hypothetical protein
VKGSLLAAQREGRHDARAVDEFLMGVSDLPSQGYRVLGKIPRSLQVQTSLT